MDTSAKTGVIEKLGMKNAADHELFVTRWAAQAATVLPPGLTLHKIKGAMCLNTQEYIMVSGSGGVACYVLASKVKAKLLKKKLLKLQPHLFRRDREVYAPLLCPPLLRFLVSAWPSRRMMISSRMSR